MSGETSALSVSYMDLFHSELSPEDAGLLKRDSDLESHTTAAACLVVAMKFSEPVDDKHVFGLSHVCQCFPLVNVCLCLTIK